MSNLTKGPWHWRESTLDDSGCGHKMMLEGADGHTICHFGEVRGDWCGESSGEEPWGDDVRLIEASYDLLVALVAARRAMTNPRYNVPWESMADECAMVDAAYLKATGEVWPDGSHDILTTLKIAKEQP